MNYGLSGFLAPDGRYFHADYMEHDEVAKEIVELYSLEYTRNSNDLAIEGEFIKFGTYPWAKKEGCGGCHVFKSILHKLTDSQADWLAKNIDKATDKQKKELYFCLDDDEIFLLENLLTKDN